MHHPRPCYPLPRRRAVALLLASLSLLGAGAAQAANACPALLNHTLARLQDEKPMNLCEHSGKVVLVVNTDRKSVV